MSILEIIVVILNIIFCIPSVASATKFDYWWIRGFDFPRIQISVLIIFNIILATVVYDFTENWHFFILFALAASLLYQLYLIFPYTPVAKKQTIQYVGDDNDDNLSILVSNVLMDNTGYQDLIDLVRFKDPDILLTLESDRKWEEKLAVLELTYRHTVKIPLENLYGMHLYSKFPLKDIKVRYLIATDIPSIHGKLKLINGQMVTIHCLHPRPPSPNESKTSTNRDAELLLVGKEIDENDKLVLVFGDLNDVAWSRTTKLFQKMSGLMDPRRGRGFFNTYNANHKLLRWPLDHVFHSDDFTLVAMERERNIGSDHFPMYIKLNYAPKATNSQDDLEASKEEKEWAEDKIDAADPNQREI